MSKRLVCSLILGGLLGLSQVHTFGADAEPPKPAAPAAPAAPVSKPSEKPTFQLTDEEKKDGWVVLFDGTNTDNFRAYKGKEFPAKGWIIEDGCLRHVQGAGGGDIITKEEYGSFELSLEWKVGPGSNSGVMYNVSEESGPSYMTGPEMQVLDDTKHPDGKNPKTAAGALYAMIPGNADKTVKPVGEFNEAKLVMKKNHGEHWLNGKKIVEYDKGGEEWNKLVAGSKFKAWPKFGKNDKGFLAFQDHGNDVWFRNIKIRPIKDEAAK